MITIKPFIFKRSQLITWPIWTLSYVSVCVSDFSAKVHGIEPMETSFSYSSDISLWHWENDVCLSLEGVRSGLTAQLMRGLSFLASAISHVTLHTWYEYLTCRCPSPRRYCPGRPVHRSESLSPPRSAIRTNRIYPEIAMSIWEDEWGPVPGRKSWGCTWHRSALWLVCRRDCRVDSVPSTPSLYPRQWTKINLILT